MTGLDEAGRFHLGLQPAEISQTRGSSPVGNDIGFQAIDRRSAMADMREMSGGP